MIRKRLGIWYVFFFGMFLYILFGLSIYYLFFIFNVFDIKFLCLRFFGLDSIFFCFMIYFLMDNFVFL